MSREVQPSPALDLVSEALRLKLAIELRDKGTARAAAHQVARLLPLVRLQAQQIRPMPKERERELADVRAERFDLDEDEAT